MVNIIKDKKLLNTLDIIIWTIIIVTFLLLYGKHRAIKKTSENSIITWVVKFDSAKLDYNNSVGNSWIFSASVNGKKLELGDSVELEFSKADRISIKAGAQEQDTIPDTGVGNKTISISNLEMGRNNKFPINVVVTENRGRYSGNNAKWILNFSIRRKVSFFEIIKNIF